MVLKNAFIPLGNAFLKSDLLIDGGAVSDISPNIPDIFGAEVFDLNNCFIFPGLLDVHVHLREPGFSYKETIASGTLAAAHGGFTGVCAMPNLSPVPDSLVNLAAELELIEKTAVIPVYPFGSISVRQEGKELSRMEEMAPYVKGFSDDGRGVNSSELMLDAMKNAKKLGLPIVAHCEDLSYGGAGCIHDGTYARTHSLKGISSESEYKAIEKDLELLRKTDCAYHICHVSAKESVSLIRQAKKEGLNVTAETAPHYLLLDENDLTDSGSCKMNPPLRAKADREALIEGIRDGTIDIIATDHAPHSEEEKSKGLEGSVFGITGIETSFSLCYTELVRKGILTLNELLTLMHKNPSERFSIGSGLKKGSRADLCVFDLNSKYTISEESLLSMGKSTPFIGKEVYGICKMTIESGRIKWTQQKEN